MSTIADNWWNEDRRDLFRVAAVVASEAGDPTLLGESLDIILKDLELYDDPRQGAGLWLYENELQLADRFGAELHNVLGDTVPEEAGAAALASADWLNARATAAALLTLMEANGDFIP